MVNFKIYIEGGGEGKDLDSRFREAWTKFFKTAGLEGRMPRPVRGRGRKNTYELFCTALKNQKPDQMPLLLIDSEDTVEKGGSIWQHLKQRDQWTKPTEANEQHVYLMVQVMETWLLADIETLRRYFGAQFKPDKIPAWNDLEAIPKQSVFIALDKATAGCSEKRYTKGRVSFEILSLTDSRQVGMKCPNAKRLLDFLTANK